MVEIILFFTLMPLIYIYTLKKNKIKFISLYSLFFIQNYLYIGFNDSLLFIGLDESWYHIFSLTGDPFLLQQISLITLSSFFVFSFIYAKTKTKKINTQKPFSWSCKYEKYLTLSMVLLFFLIYIIGIKFPYGQPMPHSIHSIISNIEVIAVGLAIYKILNTKNNKLRSSIIIMLLLMVAIEKSRLYLLLTIPGIFAFYYYELKKINKYMLVFGFLFIVVFFAIIGVVRMDGTIDSPIQILLPIYWETLYSTYAGLSSIYLNATNQIQYHLFGASYIIDPIINFVPRFILPDKDNITLINHWTAIHENFLVDGVFNPVGGWWYLCDTIANFSIFGTILFHSIIGFVFKKFDNLQNLFFRYILLGSIGTTFLTENYYQSFRYSIQPIASVLAIILMFEFIFKKSTTINAQRIYFNNT